MSLSTTWGTTAGERSIDFPCARFEEHVDAAYYRGVTIQSRPDAIFRWLCQMRVAPYSYDWIDNLGRRSPRTLTPGLDELVIGQQFLSGFELVEFEHNRHITIRTRPQTLDARIFGNIVNSYLIVPQASDTCRLIVKSVVRYRKGPIGWFMRAFLPWGI